MGIDEKLGTLRLGSIADVSTFELKKDRFTFRGIIGKTMIGNRLLTLTTIVKGGKISSGRPRLMGRE